MSKASRCDRCGVLFEPKVGDLQLVELSEHCKPPKDRPESDTLTWHQSIIDEDDPSDFCTACSNDLRDFLKPIQRVTKKSVHPKSGRTE